MRSDTEDQYERMYDTYRGDEEADRNARRTVSDLKEAIRRAASLHDASLRSDARYFLLANFYQMVFRPLRNDGSSALMEASMLDIERIVQVARAFAGPEPISGNDVLRATSLLIGKLRTAASEIWG